MKYNKNIIIRKFNFDFNYDNTYYIVEKILYVNNYYHILFRSNIDRYNCTMFNKFYTDDDIKNFLNNERKEKLNKLYQL